MNHNNNPTIWELVKHRLPFLNDLDETKALVSSFTFEVMVELEQCFRVDNLPKDGDETNVGKEDKYSYLQKIIIADLVACYVILYFRSRASFGDGELNTNTEMPKYLKRTKAGSVEVEWDKATLTGFSNYDLDNLFMQLRNSAIRKAFNMGCIIEWTDELLAMEMAREHEMPLRVFTSDCGCTKKKIIERG